MAAVCVPVLEMATTRDVLRAGSSCSNSVDSSLTAAAHGERCSDSSCSLGDYCNHQRHSIMAPPDGYPKKDDRAQQVEDGEHSASWLQPACSTAAQGRWTGPTGPTRARRKF